MSARAACAARTRAASTAPRLCALAFAFAFALVTPAARAQQWLAAGEGTVASGLEGGGDPRGVVRRMRTTVRIGGDLRVDERPNEFYSAAVLLEVEPHTSFGADVRYGRVLSPRWTVDVGAMGYLLPETLLGVTAGAMVRDRPGRGFAFTVGPRVNILFLGSDLPTSRPIWQVLVCGGFHVDL